MTQFNQLKQQIYHVLPFVSFLFEFFKWYGASKKDFVVVVVLQVINHLQRHFS